MASWHCVSMCLHPLQLEKVRGANEFQIFKPKENLTENFPVFTLHLKSRPLILTQKDLSFMVSKISEDREVQRGKGRVCLWEKDVPGSLDASLTHMVLGEDSLPRAGRAKKMWLPSDPISQLRL